MNLKINQLYMSGKETGLDSEFQLKSDAYLEASAKGLDLEEENGYITDLDYNNFGISGYGAGLDLGSKLSSDEEPYVLCCHPRLRFYLLG